MADALLGVSTRRTPQTDRARRNQVRNSAGGYVFKASDEARLMRFLMLGTEGGTYYVGEREHTKENTQFLFELIERDPRLVVRTVLDVSIKGRAAKQNPTIFALAACASAQDQATRELALGVFTDIVRTGTHLFLFCSYVQNLRGWGPMLKRAVASWYLSRPANSLAYQVAKYRQREGWTHRDVLRLSHPRPPQTWTEVDLRPPAFTRVDMTTGTPLDPPRGDSPELVEAKLKVSTLRFAAGKGDDIPNHELPRILQDFRVVQEDPSTAPALVRKGSGISWEMIPDAALTNKDTWAALIEHGMPTGALLRQLPRLTSLGLFEFGSVHTKLVVNQLRDPEVLKKARVHPVSVLLAMRTYASGKSVRGSGTWTPAQKVVDALDDAFYAAFGAVEPTGKPTVLGIDVSGSMSWSSSMCGPITAAEGAAAMAMVTAAVEEEAGICAFSSGFEHLPISPRMRLDDVLRVTGEAARRASSTDCALPMLWATQNKLSVETFVVYTDNETWAGQMHPFQALEQYRQKSGINAKLAVVGMTSTGFTIANPEDPGMLDLVGFDSATPSALSAFASA